MKKLIRMGLCILISSTFVLSFSKIKADEEYYVVFDFENLEYNFNRNIIEGTDVETLKKEIRKLYPGNIYIGVKEFKSDGTPLNEGMAFFPVEWDFASYDASEEKQVLTGRIVFEKILDEKNKFPFYIGKEIKSAKVNQENMDEMNEKIHLTLHSIKQDSEQPVFSVYHPYADGPNYSYLFSMPVLPNVNEVYSEYSLDGGKSWSENKKDENYFWAGDDAYKSAGIYLNIPFTAVFSEKLEKGEITSLHYRLRIVTSDSKPLYSTSLKWPLTLNKIDSINDSGGDRGDVGDTEETPSTPIEPEETPKPTTPPKIEEEFVNKHPSQNIEVSKPFVSSGTNTNLKEIVNEGSTNVTLIDSVLPEGKQQVSQIPMMEKDIPSSRKKVARNTQKVQADEDFGGFRISPGMAITLISFIVIGGVSVSALHFKKKRF